MQFANHNRSYDNLDSSLEAIEDTGEIEYCGLIIQTPDGNVTVSKNTIEEY